MKAPSGLCSESCVGTDFLSSSQPFCPEGASSHWHENEMQSRWHSLHTPSPCALHGAMEPTPTSWLIQIKPRTRWVLKVGRNNPAVNEVEDWASLTCHYTDHMKTSIPPICQPYPIPWDVLTSAGTLTVISWWPTCGPGRLSCESHCHLLVAPRACSAALEELHERQ